MSAHTKGPWRLSDTHGPHGDILVSGGDPTWPHDIAYVPRDEPDAEAHARLIAAAPELLAALEFLVTYAHEAKPVKVELGKALELAQARAVIAKARGGQ